MRVSCATKQDARRMALIAADNPHSAHWGEGGFAEEIAQSCARVFKMEDDGGFLCGFICYRTVSPSAELTNFAVDSAFLRRGIGSALLKESLKYLAAEEIKEVTLEVNVNNKVAVSLYERNFFVTLNYRKKFYNNTEDAAIMHRSI